ncbi:DUF4864 domain-containing protein [Inquilinus sp. CAU 1745]|uniref:DUF4864 domain-containing protein n=1 Tax=Inquilinus sp. CAU 1745 TaxID=3140369 RepID=UPI00325BFB51
MRSALYVLAFILLIAAPARAQDMSSDQAAVRTVIESQIAAFRADDGPLAFSYASPMIRRIFRTPENFMNMVRTGYPPVYRPRSVDFLDFSSESGVPTQRVLFVGPDGATALARYYMQKQPDGSWKINGVEITLGGGQSV